MSRSIVRSPSAPIHAVLSGDLWAGHHEASPRCACHPAMALDMLEPGRRVYVHGSTWTAREAPRRSRQETT